MEYEYDQLNLVSPTRSGNDYGGGYYEGNVVESEHQHQHDYAGPLDERYEPSHQLHSQGGGSTAGSNPPVLAPSHQFPYSAPYPPQPSSTTSPTPSTSYGTHYQPQSSARHSESTPPRSRESSGRRQGSTLSSAYENGAPQSVLDRRHQQDSGVIALDSQILSSNYDQGMSYSSFVDPSSYEYAPTSMVDHALASPDAAVEQLSALLGLSSPNQSQSFHPTISPHDAYSMPPPTPQYQYQSPDVDMTYEDFSPMAAGDSGYYYDDQQSLIDGAFSEPVSSGVEVGYFEQDPGVGYSNAPFGGNISAAMEVLPVGPPIYPERQVQGPRQRFQYHTPPISQKPSFNPAGTTSATYYGSPSILQQSTAPSPAPFQVQLKQYSASQIADYNQNSPASNYYSVQSPTFVQPSPTGSYFSLGGSESTQTSPVTARFPSNISQSPNPWRFSGSPSASTSPTQQHFPRSPHSPSHVRHRSNSITRPQPSASHTHARHLSQPYPLPHRSYSSNDLSQRRLINSTAHGSQHSLASLADHEQQQQYDHGVEELLPPPTMSHLSQHHGLSHSTSNPSLGTGYSTPESGASGPGWSGDSAESSPVVPSSAWKSFKLPNQQQRAPSPRIRTSSRNGSRSNSARTSPQDSPARKELPLDSQYHLGLSNSTGSRFGVKNPVLKQDNDGGEQSATPTLAMSPSFNGAPASAGYKEIDRAHARGSSTPSVLLPAPPIHRHRSSASSSSSSLYTPPVSVTATNIMDFDTQPTDFFSSFAADQRGVTPPPLSGRATKSKSQPPSRKSSSGSLPAFNRRSTMGVASSEAPPLTQGQQAARSLGSSSSNSTLSSLGVSIQGNQKQHTILTPDSPLHTSLFNPPDPVARKALRAAILRESRAAPSSSDASDSTPQSTSTPDSSTPSRQARQREASDAFDALRNSLGVDNLTGLGLGVGMGMGMAMGMDMVQRGFGMGAYGGSPGAQAKRESGKNSGEGSPDVYIKGEDTEDDGVMNKIQSLTLSKGDDERMEEDAPINNDALMGRSDTPPLERDRGKFASRQLSEALIKETKRYLETPNRLFVGERTVLVLNSKIVQRSYGSEKRFLCPQPMALLLGASWWNNIEGPLLTANNPLTHRKNVPPSVFLSLNTDEIPTPAPTAWMDVNGEICEERTNEEVVLAGRATAKSLYIASSIDAGKKKALKTQVTVVAPGQGAAEARLIGNFPGKAMTVISKPSKKRQKDQSNMTLTHGNIVALYNRTKSQTGSTRFLGISGHHASFPNMDWRAMTSGQMRPFIPADVTSTRFQPLTGSWDAFVIYVVDMNLDSSTAEKKATGAPYPGMPRPPINALPHDPINPLGIYYNQPIVLQCLATSVVSPVMIIRKVEGKSTAVGGGSMDGFVTHPSHCAPCAPGEQAGEPVSQFRPMCLEIASNPGQRDTDGRPSTLPLPNTFLACLKDSIGMSQAEGDRIPYFPPSPPADTSPISPRPTDWPPRAPSGLPSGGPEHENQGAFFVEDAASSGPKRVRRMSSTSNVAQGPYEVPPRPASSLTKAKRRGQSLSSLAQLRGEDSSAPPSVWTIDCGDACVWTIVGIDVARHTFYVPPSITTMKQSATASASGSQTIKVPPLYSTPIPSYPIHPDIPVVFDYDPPGASSTGPEDSLPERKTMITIFGDNLSDHFHVWLGSTPCTDVIYHSPQMIFVNAPPTSTTDTQPQQHVGLNYGASLGKRIVLIRLDGVVFPSNVYYNPAPATT